MDPQTNQPASSTANQGTPPVQPDSGNAQPQAIDWSSAIPKGAEKVFESYKGKPLTDVFNTFVEAQKTIGGSIRLPKADAKPDERAKALSDIYAKLGRPESPDKYDLGELPLINDTFQWNQERLATAKTALHQAGLTNDQVKSVMGVYANELKSLFPDQVTVAAESRQKMIDEYGSEQMFERQLNFAQSAVKQYGDAEFNTWLETTGLGNHPAFIKVMSKIGRELTEHGALEPSSGDLNMTSADAQQKINEIMNDPKDVYWAKLGTPGKDERVKEVQNLWKMVSGEL